MSKKEIEKLFLQYQTTGECLMNIPRVLDAWDETCFISQWHDEYTLIMHQTEEHVYNVKARISNKQAHEIIVKLDLTGKKSSIFVNGTTWK